MRSAAEAQDRDFAVALDFSRIPIAPRKLADFSRSLTVRNACPIQIGGRSSTPVILAVDDYLLKCSSQRAVRRLGPGARALAGCRHRCRCRGASACWPRAGAREPLDAQVAVLAVARLDDHRPVPAGARGVRQPSSGPSTRARPRDPDGRLDPARPATDRPTSGSGTLAGGPARHDPYGFADWDGNDQHFMGWAGTGVHFDPIIAERGARGCVRTRRRRPAWFLTVALVNPHDVMWFPMDQPAYQPTAHPTSCDRVRRCSSCRSGRTTTSCRCSRRLRRGVRRAARRTSTTTCSTSPTRTGSGAGTSSTGSGATSIPTDKQPWRRQLDYYVRLHQLADDGLGTVLGALEAAARGTTPSIIFTSDHGDMCGSHGLRSKGPFVYDEIMHVPCYVNARPASRTAGTRRRARDPRRSARRRSARSAASTRRRNRRCGAWTSRRVLRRPAASVRDHVLFAHDTAHTDRDQPHRYAIRGFFDGSTSTRATTASAAAARRPACGEAIPATSSTTSTPRSKTRNTSGTTRGGPARVGEPRATTAARRAELRQNYQRLLEYERREMSP